MIMTKGCSPFLVQIINFSKILACDCGIEISRMSQRSIIKLTLEDNAAAGPAAGGGAGAGAGAGVVAGAWAVP